MDLFSVASDEAQSVSSHNGATSSHSLSPEATAVSGLGNPPVPAASDAQSTAPLVPTVPTACLACV